ncbi:MAG: hypothetical protein KTV16_08365 [Acidimicrobiia bacterium]|nr:hypothetical protein [Acidimicrobiia bacterium]
MSSGYTDAERRRASDAPFDLRPASGSKLAQRSLRENGNPDISFMVEQSRIQVTVGSAKRSGVKR